MVPNSFYWPKSLVRYHDILRAISVSQICHIFFLQETNNDEIIFVRIKQISSGLQFNIFNATSASPTTEIKELLNVYGLFRQGGKLTKVMTWVAINLCLSCFS